VAAARKLIDVRRSITFLMAVLLAPGAAAAQPVGAVGESCRARSDCGEGLRCIQNVCTNPCGDKTCDGRGGEDCNTCPRDCGPCKSRPTTPAATPAAAPAATPAAATPAKSKRWKDFELQGTHFFGGFTIGPGMTGQWAYGGPVEVEGAFFFAFRLGVLLDRMELGLEISPRAWLWDFEPEKSSFSLNVSIGGYLEVADNAYWPLRFGLGFTTGDMTRKDVYMQGRLDIIGLVYQYGHLLFELNLPSTRFHSEMKEYGIWAWLFNISITYVL
jgi:hypothetical protein